LLSLRRGGFAASGGAVETSAMVTPRGERVGGENGTLHSVSYLLSSDFVSEDAIKKKRK